ncbi:acyl carrier protein [Roseibium sp.]|uniref:acyl carrier protein n=1 Tax=Roseibium sp. TaxID=1936156 RepID=UPI0039EF18DA
MSEVLNIISTVLKVDKSILGVETSIDSISTWDSLKHMELIASLEDQLSIEYTGDEIAEMMTIGQILDVTERYINRK